MTAVHRFATDGKMIATVPRFGGPGQEATDDIDVRVGRDPTFRMPGGVPAFRRRHGAPPIFVSTETPMLFRRACLGGNRWWIIEPASVPSMRTPGSAGNVVHGRPKEDPT